jgi:hypothetical protein
MTRTDHSKRESESLTTATHRPWQVRGPQCIIAQGRLGVAVQIFLLVHRQKPGYVGGKQIRL